MYGGRAQSRSTGLFLFLCAAMLLLAMLSQQSWAASARGAAKSALAPVESAMTSLAAQVIGRGPDSFSRTMQIDRGTADGVHPGMVVGTGAGLLGRVREAGPHAAIVQTLGDPQSRVNV